MDLNPCLYVEIHPYDGPHSPHPHPIDEGHFDPDYVYKVLTNFWSYQRLYDAQLQPIFAAAK